jgi:hypothetical protein
VEKESEESELFGDVGAKKVKDEDVVKSTNGKWYAF